MTELRTPDDPKHEPPPKTEYLALGCGCLVTLIFFAAVVYVGVMRG